MGMDYNASGIDLSQSPNWSPVLDVSKALSFSFQALVTGSAAGTLTLVGSNIDGAPLVAGIANANFQAVSGSQYSQTVSGAGQFMFEYTRPGFKRAALLWVPSGGTGQLSVYGWVNFV